MKKKNTLLKICVVMPAFKSKNLIFDVLNKIGNTVDKIYVIDDFCPEKTGSYVLQNSSDKRIIVIINKKNMGVGGAVIEGYKMALKDKMDIIVKIDSDGQMDPKIINHFTEPIVSGEADYTKGNRFYNLEKIWEMPKTRVIGNAILSIMTKFSSGYWNIFDPTNGYTAIHCNVLSQLPFSKINKEYFFESDMLFRLNLIGAVVIDVPMHAKYGSEVSNLKIIKIIHIFIFNHFRNIFKRIFYQYYLRDMSLASIQLFLGLIFFIYGSFYGLNLWIKSIEAGLITSAGAASLSALLILIGINLILSFLGYDISNVPKRPIQKNKF